MYCKMYCINIILILIIIIQNHHNNNKNNNLISNIHILGWADKFAGRGAGIEADNTVNGVIFNFYILPDNQLSIFVTESMITSNVRDLTVLTSYKSNIEENDGKWRNQC